MRSEDIFEHQINTLVSLVQRWHAAGGADHVLELRVREFVSAELIGRGNADVIARAIGALGDAEADRLNDMVNHCSQTFYSKSEVWSAFAVPVAVMWHMRPHRLYIAKRGEQEYLKDMAAGIRQCTGAQAVHLHPFIYSAKTLHMATARTIYGALQNLVIRAPRFAPDLQAMHLRSASEPPWRMAYFLGVEVTDAKSRRQLNEPGVQDALQGYVELGAQALTMPTQKFNLGAHGHTICYPPRYLHDAIQFGERALRGYRLRQILEEIGKDEARVTLFYAFNQRRYAVELLAAGKWLAFGVRWDLFRDETVDDFLSAANLAMAESGAQIECKLVEVELDELTSRRSASVVDLSRLGKI